MLCLDLVPLLEDRDQQLLRCAFRRFDDHERLAILPEKPDHLGVRPPPVRGDQYGALLLTPGNHFVVPDTHTTGWTAIIAVGLHLATYFAKPPRSAWRQLLVEEEAHDYAALSA